MTSVRLCDRARQSGFSYGYVQVIVNASLRVTESEFVYVIGPNGGGKTTLLKLIVGLLKPQSGAVRVSAWSLRKPVAALDMLRSSPVTTCQCR